MYKILVFRILYQHYLQLSIIIVNYNVKYFLEQCLYSLQSAIECLEAEIWVVDNASTDGSIEYLQPKFPAVNYISNTTNAGFGKANNQALHRCQGKWVLYLNPDTILPEDCLVKCLNFLQSNQNVGGLGIRMIDGSGNFLPESKRSFPSPMTSFYKLIGLSRLFPKSKTFSKYALAYLDQHQNHEVDVLAGAFLIARRDVLVQLGGFDEAFFMYGEDIDLSYRIQQKGYKNYYFSESTIIHFKGESTSKGSLNYVKMFYQAMSIFVRKHYAGTSANLFAYSIQAAIWFRASLTAVYNTILKLGLPLSKLIKKTSVAVGKQKMAVVGTKAEVEEVRLLLKNAGLQDKLIETIIVGENGGEAIVTLRDLDQTIERLHIKEVVFCQGFLKNTTIIKLVQQLGNKISVRFHKVRSDSIVGSDSKNSSGVSIA